MQKPSGKIAGKKQIQRRPRSANAKAAALPRNELETAAREPLAEIVARMAEREMAAALAPQRTPESGATRSAGLQPGTSLPGVGDDHISTGPTSLGTGRNACATDAALKRGTTSFSATSSRSGGTLRRTTPT